MGPQEVVQKLSDKAAAGARSWFPPTLVALYDNNYGLALIALAQLFFACMSMSVKFLMETTAMSTLTLIFVRMGITGACCWAALLIQRDPHPFLGPPELRRLLALRGLAGFAGLLCAYQAFRGLSVSDTITIGFLTPTVTALLGYLLLKESFSLREAVSGFVSLFGVILISRPPFIFGHFGHHHNKTGPVHPERDAVTVSAKPHEVDSTARMIAVSWACVGVFCSATAYLTIRHIGHRASPLHSISWFSLACTLASGIAIIVNPLNQVWPKDSYGFWLIILIGIFGFLAQALLTVGLQNEKAGRAGLAMYLQIFFAVILEVFVFHTFPSFLSLIGMTIILSSAAWVAMSSLKSAPPPQVDDEEAQPISRSASPIPSGSKTVRGELYSYSALPTEPGPSGLQLSVPTPPARSPSPREASPRASPHPRSS